MKKTDQYVKVRGFQRVSLIGRLNFKEMFKKCKKSLSIKYVSALFWGLFLFFKKVNLWKIPFEISQPLLNCENYVVASYFHFTKISAPGVQFTTVLLHFHCTLTLHIYSVIFCSFNDQEKIKKVQLNKYETDPYFLQIFQSNTLVCLIISVFCKSSEPNCEPEITPVLYHLENLQKSKQN